MLPILKQKLISKFTSINVFQRPISTGKLFAGLWLLVFLIYLPAARSGFVTDFTGWLDQTRRFGFWDNINRTHYVGHSLYQFTQFNTWVFYQFFGANAWLWHLLYITLHAINATLLCKLATGIMDDAGVENGQGISIAGVVLFCASPSLSEVVIWEPSFHYLQGLLLILLVLFWTRNYILTGQKKYAAFAGLVFLLSTFSLEIFYITPWLVLTMVFFYRFQRPASGTSLKAALINVFLPQLLMFGAHLYLFHVVYGSWFAHIGGNPVVNAFHDGMGKPAKHLFNILFLGRFFNNETRHTIYAFCDSAKGLAIFYVFVAAALGLAAFRFNRLAGRGKVAVLLLSWVLITLAILIPLWFEELFLVVYDRYTYFTNGFLFILLPLMVSYIPVAAVRLGLIGLYMVVNLRFSVQVSRYWMKSTKVISPLLNTFPDTTDKTVILLNVPQNMHGVPMIGAEKESEFKLMHDLLITGKNITAHVYDAQAYNMLTPEDGANVTVINDSTLKVTLNQWGTWWWYAMQGGQSYTNTEYTLNLKDPGHYYELTLKKPASQYLLLYQVGSNWKIVDMSKRNEQD